ncbi:Hypothetical protein GSB_154904 [Giardia duodenalis]|uniref:EGF-like domain-containing protein n=1 Tax=Giardia intestinalis TaxID=5741 RepID=V6TQC8_GIAIN|nr:Hypothetical protein GSB_154904 [Giardia intestinalis]
MCCEEVHCAATAQPNAYTATTQDICGGTGEYTTFGDPNDPFVTCTPNDSNNDKVSAYNGTFFAKPGCVRVSKIDKTRRFYCGFLEGLTDNLPTSTPPTCAVPSDQSSTAETCTACPTDFHLVHLEDGTKTYMHENCHSSRSSSRMWYDYCGGTGDCIKKADQANYACDCGTGARWNDTLKTCITEVCKLDPKLVGSYAPEYCAAPSSASLHCTVGRDTTWQCDCPRGDYTTYNKTCILKAKNADPTTKLARGPCGGPGAGYINDNGSCTCNAGFRRVGDLCYSYDCLPVGVTADTKGLDLNLHVCSGKGVCAYNQLTGRYGCECDTGYEAFGGYCTQPGCAGKVIHNGEIKYVECKVYDGTVGSCVQNANKNTYSCSCKFPYKPANGLCVHQRCMPGDVYCGGDALAACVKGSDYYYSCVCSEGYEKGQLYDECIPSKCVYRNSLSDLAVACNGLGTCSGEGSLLKNRKCACNSNAQLVTLRDASGELRQTCVLASCISSSGGVDPPIICGGLGRCGSSGCICNDGYTSFGNTCVSPKCLINTISANNAIATSICGGDTIGECVKTGTAGTFEDYTCKCKDGLTGYEVVDGFCLPSSCIFEVKVSEGNTQKTMCGGSHLGSCILNLTESVKAHCKCENWYTVVQIDTGKCMHTNCLSKILPGNPSQKLECSGHGTCRGSKNTGYSCTCESNYETLSVSGQNYLCIPSKCLTSSTGLEKICSGRGQCSLDKDTEGCKCYTEYTGDKCETCAAGHKEYTDKRCYPTDCPEDDSCSAEATPVAGTCQLVNSRFVCVCTDSSFIIDKQSKKCRKSKCFYTDPYDNIEKKRYNMGYCDDSGETEKCSCSSGTILVGTGVCVYTECMPESSKDDPATICNKRGTCIRSSVDGKGMCQCDSNVYRTDKKSGQCFVKECFGAADSILSEVCDGGSTCDENTKKCNCNVDGFQSLSGQNGCAHTNCISSDSKLCSGFGACEKIDGSYRCLCASHYTLVEKDCVPTNCLNSTVTCNGGGTCTGTGASANCSCRQGWASHGALCYPAVCVANGLICDGNGRCVFENGVTPTCVCNEGFTLTDDFICGVPAFSNKSSAGTTIATVVVVLLVLAAVAGFLVWWFVIRPRKGGALRERAPRKDASLTRSRSLKKQAASGASFHANAPLLSQLSNANSSIQL